MPESEKHKETYAKNKEFLDGGINQKGNYNNWTIIVMFYCAVHAIEYMLSRFLNRHSKGHGFGENGRITHINAMRNLKGYDEFLEGYTHLRDEAYASRYDCIEQTNNDVFLAQKYLDNIIRISGIEK